MTTLSHSAIRSSVIALALPLLLAACALLPGQTMVSGESHFTQDGYEVTCRWAETAIEGTQISGIDPEAESYCRARARDAVGTVLAREPDAEVISVTVEADGSASACTQDVDVVGCGQVLGPMPGR
jgi:hypothetical protein